MTETEQLATAHRLLELEAFASTCEFRPIMDQVTSRWAQLIVAALLIEPHRFSALASRIGGISQKMLSQNLKALVRAGLVSRDVVPTIPPQVTYSLTELGTSLAKPMTELIAWFGRHSDQLLQATTAHDDQNA
ncbi:helix-turn-helix domain-containing protein [Microbacterium sp. AZCO]|uniref:winged helix-turn-helix transcriptional regulator n=1 Tax=Microbacterium sp. AZCO TaxID=3142976 RepID=UPI0031F387C1